MKRIASVALSALLVFSLSPYGNVPWHAEPAFAGDGGASAPHNLTLGTQDDGDAAEPATSGNVGEQGWIWRLVEGSPAGTYKLTFEFAGDLAEGAEPPALAIPANFAADIAGALGENAGKITALDVPAGVKSIGDSAFLGLDALEAATIGSTVERIGADAFGNCAALKEAILPDALKSLGARAFSGCTSLEKASLPATRYFSSDPGTHYFAGCASLKELSFRTVESAASYNSANRRYVPNYTLSNCPALEKLDLSGYSNLGQTFSLNNLFLGSDCSSIEEIVLPTGTNVTIASASFPNKTGLSDMGVFANPQSVTEIQKGAFIGSGISQADLSSWTGLKQINESAFSSCPNLASATIPANVTTLGKLAFANNQMLTDVRVDAKNLTKVSDDIFDGSAKLETVTIGKDVETLTGDFLVAAAYAKTIAFEGESVVKIAKPTVGGGLSPLKDLSGTYYVDPQGVLYQLDDDGTASLAYVPRGVKSYSVPASISVPAENGVAAGTYTVDRMNPHAVHLAGNLASLDFAAPGQVAIAPNAFTGRSTSDDAQDLKVNGKTKIAAADFKEASILCDYPMDDEADMNLVPEIASEIKKPNGDEAFSTIIAVNDRKPGEDGNYHLQTGEKLKYTIAISNHDNQYNDRVIRIYFAYDSPGANLGSFPVGATQLVMPGSSKKFPMKIVETDTPGIYYYDVTDVFEGETLAFQNDVFYPSPETPGGGLKIWTHMLSPEEAEAKAGKIIDPGDYIGIDWSTTPVVYDLHKDNSGHYLTSENKKVNPKLQANASGEALVNNLAYYIYEKNEGSAARTEGLDFIRWVQYEDTLNLPDELLWREKVIQAIKNGPYDDTQKVDGWKLATGSYTLDTNSSSTHYVVQAVVGGKTYDVAYLYSPTRTYKDIKELTPQIVKGADGRDTIRLTWYLNNSSLKDGTAANEYQTHRFYLRYGDDVILADLDKVNELMSQTDESGNKLMPTVDNSVDEVRHYSYSENQIAEADRKTTIDADAGLAVTKDWDNSPRSSVSMYYGQDDFNTVAFKNTGIMDLSSWGSPVYEKDGSGNTVKDEKGNPVILRDESNREVWTGDILKDDLANYFYIEPANLDKMLRASATLGSGASARSYPLGDWLSVTIAKASLFTPGQYQPADGTEQAGKYSSGTSSDIYARPTSNPHDNGARVYEGATLSLSSDGSIITLVVDGDAAEEGFNGTYTIGEGGDYPTLADAFTAIGYMPTRQTAYKLLWHTDDFVLKAGETLKVPVLTTYKTTPMMLERDGQRSLNASGTTTRNTAVWGGRVGDDIKTGQTATEYTYHWLYNELFLYKYGFVEGSTSQLSGSEVKADDGSVLDYQIRFYNRSGKTYDHISTSDYMSGAQVALIPKAENPQLEGAGLDEFTSNGKTYYLLNKPGTYDDVVIGVLGGSSTGVSARNAKQTMHASIVVTESVSAGKRTSLNTQINWSSLDNWGSGSFGGSNNNSTNVFYKVLVSGEKSGLASGAEDGATATYTINNKAWLGDHQGHRLWDKLGGAYQVYGFDKSIVDTENGGKGDGTDSLSAKTLTDYTRITSGTKVTYQIVVNNLTSTSTVLTGDRIRDRLPSTGGVFDWTRGGDDVAANVANLRYVASNSDTKITVGTGDDQVVLNNDGTPNQNDTYWKVEQASSSGTPVAGAYDIKWDKDFAITFAGRGSVKIFVDLTFPDRTEGDSTWDQYVAAVHGDLLYNTFYLDGRSDWVTHSLAADGKAVLYKGVIDTGMTTRHPSYTSTDRLQYNSNKSRLMYSNGVGASVNGYDPDLKAATVTYYTVLYNGSYDRLYLSDLQDQLPRGFRFSQMCNYGSTTTYTNGGSSSTAYMGYTAYGIPAVQSEYATSSESSKLVAIDNSGDKLDVNTVKYVNASVAAKTANGSDGRQHITFTVGSASDRYSYPGIKYDSKVGKYYLAPGQALRFGYNVLVDEYAKTDDLATNTIAMPYYDYYDTEFTLDVPDSEGKGGAIQKPRAVNGVRNNDGFCEQMTGDQVKAQFGMDPSAYTDPRYTSLEDGNWLVSGVTVERAGITPGVQKTVGGITAGKNGATATTIQGSKGSDVKLYGDAYTGGALKSDIINWRVRVFNEAGTGDADVTGIMQDYTVKDTVATPFAFAGQVFYNTYVASSAAGQRVTTSSQQLFTLGSRSMGDTTVKVTAGNGTSNANWVDLKIGSADDDSDDAWFTFGTGVKAGRAKLEREADGRETLTIEMKGTAYSIPGGYWSDFCIHTQFNATDTFVSAGKYNDVILTTVQDYDAADVVQGRALTHKTTDADGNEVIVNDGVQSGASVILTQGYNTESWKAITQIDKTSNNARSDGSPNYIVLPEKSDTFRYDLYVVGPQAVMERIVIIDDLPDKGDHSAFVKEDTRNSEFKVSFLESNPDFKVYVAPSKAGTEKVLDPKYYTIEVNTKSEFTGADWEGAGDGWVSIKDLSGDELAAVLKDARSVRVDITDPKGWQDKDKSYLMSNQAKIRVSFNGRIDDKNAKPGQYAWNSFGYKYWVPYLFGSTPEATKYLPLEAQPLNVGIRYPASPSMEKKLQWAQEKMVQKMVEVDEPVMVQDVDGEGNPVLDDEGNPVMVPKTEIVEELVYEPKLDEEGNPVLDEDGNPVMVPKTETVLDEDGNPVVHPVTKAVEKPVMQKVKKPATRTIDKLVVDDEGNPVLDENGKPKKTTLTVPVMEPAMEPVVDDEGNPVTDDDGKPVMKPVLETVSHEATSDIEFGYIIYEGEPIEALNDALDMTNEQIAAVLEGTGKGLSGADARNYIYIPLTVKAGSSSARVDLSAWDHPARYDEETQAFADDGTRTWKWKDSGVYTVIELPYGDYGCTLAELRAGSNIGTENNIKFTNGVMSVVRLIASNEWKPEYIDVSGTKTWDDADNQDGMQPESITVRLWADGKEVDSQVVTAETDWKWEFKHLVKTRESGADIVYQVTEDAVEEYSTTVNADGDNAYKFGIENKHTPHKRSVEVTKTWDDEENADGSRPESVTVHLYADGADTGKTLEIKAEDNWQNSFTDLDEYANGKRISYTVVEDVPEVYEAEYGGNMDTALSVANSYVPPRTSVEVAKMWDDDNDRDGMRPESVTVHLWQNGMDTGETLELNEGNHWKGAFENLLVKKDGEPATYTVTEDAVARYNEPVVASATPTSADASFAYKVDNKHVPLRRTVEVTKVWDDDSNRDGLRPASVTVHLYANGKDTGKTLTLEESNDWAGAFQNLFTYEEGQIIDYTVVEDGNVGYAIKVENTDGSEVHEPTEDEQVAYTITNTHVPARRSVEVSKVWDDDSDRDGLQPKSVTVHLLANGKDTGEKVVLNASNDWADTFEDLLVYEDGAEIAYTVEEDGNVGYEIAITGEQKPVDDKPGESRAASGKVEGGDGLGWEFAGEQIAYTVTNTHVPARRSVEVSKVWDDDSNRDGLQPESVTVHLLANGKDTGKTLELSAGNDWKGAFEDLYVYEEGAEIAYTVTEDGNVGYTIAITGAQEFVDDEPGASRIASGKVYGEGNELAWEFAGEQIAYTVTNTHEPARRSVEVSKVWDDDSNRDGLQPESVTVYLLANGVDTGKKVVLSKDNEWADVFEDLLVYEEGIEIAYTVEEDGNVGYAITVAGEQKPVDDEPGASRIASGKVEGGDGLGWKFAGEQVSYGITNTHVPVRRSVEVAKVWDDDSDRDRLQPESVTVHLFANGEDTGKTLELSAGNDWKGAFEDLYVYKEGAEIAYTVTEDGNVGYTIAIAGEQQFVDDEPGESRRESGAGTDPADPFAWTFVGEQIADTVTNTHEPALRSVEVSKVWNDDDNRDGLRPDSVTVHLLANGEDTGRTLVLDESNKWAGAFEDLFVFEEGVEIDYTVVEDGNAGYSIAIRPKAAEDETGEPAEPADGAESGETGESGDSGTPDEAGDDGDAEEPEDPFAWEFEGDQIAYEIENTHVPVTRSVDVAKVWDDDSNRDGLQPESVTVHLLADGVDTGKTLTLDKDNAWAGSFDDLLVYGAGREIAYSITEDGNVGYTIAITGEQKLVEDESGATRIESGSGLVEGDPYAWRFTGERIAYTVTNKHDPALRSVEVSKVWDDDGDSDGIRAESVTVHLLANGEDTGKTLVLDASNEWSGVFEGLHVFEAGDQIEYTVSEDSVDGYEVSIASASEGDGAASDDDGASLETQDGEGDEASEEQDFSWSFDGEQIAYTITNKHVPGTRSVKVEKVWNDSNDSDKLRPKEITVHLLANGEDTGDKLVLNAANSWKGAFENLLASDDGEPIAYTVSEDEVKGYTAKIEGDADAGFKVTNSHTPTTPTTPPSTKSVPKTGDPLPTGGLAGLAGAAFAVACFAATRMKRRER